MGMYYELKLDIKLKPIDEIGQEVHVLLIRLFNQTEADDIQSDVKSNLPEHPFWSLRRFYQLGQGGYGQDEAPRQDASYEHPVVKLRAYINYGYEEIISFLDWVTPYVDCVPEPGRYYIEGSMEYDLMYYDVRFETNPEGKKAFLMVGQYQRYGSSYQPTGVEEKTMWISSLVKK